MASMIHEHDYEPVRDGGHEGTNLLTCVTCGQLLCSLCGKAIPADAHEVPIIRISLNIVLGFRTPAWLLPRFTLQKQRYSLVLP